MSKKLFAVLLTLVMLIGVLPMAAMAESYTPDCTCGYCGATCDIKRVDEKDVTCTTDESWIEVCEKHECETERTGEEAPGHKICDEPEVSTVYEATCTKGGKIAYKYSCTVCGDMINIQYEYTSVKEHNYVDGKCECGAKEPCKHEAGDIERTETTYTCCKAGELIEYCKCGQVFKTPYPATGNHDTTNPECEQYVEPCKHEAGDIERTETTYTCCKAGELIEYCKCGQVFKTAYPATGNHDTTNPECEQYVEPCKHEAGDIVDQVITYATCCKDGSIVDTCKCGEVFTTVLPAAGEHDTTNPECKNYIEPCKHEAGDIVKQECTATCCKAGELIETCKCGEVFKTAYPAMGEHDTTNPECEQYVEPCKHEAGDIVKQECTATCCKAGELIETCKCGEVFKTAYPAMGEHDTTNPECEKYVAPCKHEAGDIVDQVITYATCRKDGSIVETCKCGEVFTTVLNKTGHDWEEATCSSPKTCKNCGKTFGRPLYRHDWAKATCKDPMTCKDCGKTFGRPLHHSWKKATCESPKTCRHCGKTVGRALKHDWAEATCKSPKTCKDCGKTVGTAHKAVDHNRNGRCDKCNIRINNFFHKYHSNKHFFNKFWKNHK